MERGLLAGVEGIGVGAVGEKRLGAGWERPQPRPSGGASSGRNARASTAEGSSARSVPDRRSSSSRALAEKMS